MSLSLFYQENFTEEKKFSLNEDSSRHIVQVLKMHVGEQLMLTNGKGETKTVEIAEAGKRSVTVNVISSSVIQKPLSNITIAISLIKNTSRWEWFLEKAVEIGVLSIIPMITQRTEKQHFRFERMKSIMISAMLQSGQSWLPELMEPMKFKSIVEKSEQKRKYIAHCIESDKKHIEKDLSTAIILIGPEGDFTSEEVELAIKNNFKPVTLGNTRLRTETAGVVSAVLLNSKKLLDT